MYGFYIRMKEQKFLNKTLYSILGAVGIYFFYHCPFLYFLGFLCLGCGMTRAFLSLLHFDIRMAFYYHPLFPIVILTGCYFIVEKLGIYQMSDKMKKIFLSIIVFLFVMTYFIRIQFEHSPIKIEIKESFFYKIGYLLYYFI